MRFEELAYAVDGLPAAVRFHGRLTVVCLSAEERADWMARLFGVLEGTRAGDSTSVVYVDRRGRRIGLDRDDQGSATLIELATGAEVPYSAGHLSLDGRFDWLASNRLTFRAASDLITVGSEVVARAAQARDARLQRALEDAEAECRATRERLKQHLAGLGFDIDGTGDLAAGAESVAARGREADNPSVDDTQPAIAERRKLEQALQRVERSLPDLAELTDKHSVLEQGVADLEASLNAGRPLVSAQEAEMILLRRAAEAGRNDRRREPLPLVVDDALAHFGTSDKRRLLDAVERCADTTQVVYLTDDPATLSWASGRVASDEITLVDTTV